MSAQDDRFTDAQRMIDAVITESIHQAIHVGLNSWADQNSHLRQRNDLIFQGIAMFVACYLAGNVNESGDVFRLSQQFSETVEQFLHPRPEAS